MTEEEAALAAQGGEGEGDAAAPAPRGREAMLARLKEFNPDSEYGDDDDAIDAFLTMHGDVDKERNDLRGISDKIAESIKANPQNSAIMEALMSGENLVPYLVKMYGKDMMSLDPDSDEFQEIVKAEEERAKNEADSFNRTAEQDAQFEKNIAASDAVFTEFAEANGMDEKGFEDFMGWFYETFAKPMFEGIYTMDTMNAAFEAYNYKDDVNQSLEAGKAAGRTEKIHASRKQTVGDGIPTVAASSGKAVAEEKTPKKKGRQDVWDL